MEMPFYHNQPFNYAYQMYPPPIYSKEEVEDVNRPLFFSEALNSFHNSFHTMLKHPSIYGITFNHINYQKLYLAVIQRGGVEEVMKSNLWDHIVEDLDDFGIEPTNPGKFKKSLKKIYINYLAHFEASYFFRAQGYKNEKVSKRNSVPFQKLHSQQAAQGAPEMD